MPRVIVELDPNTVIKAVKDMNDALGNLEKGATGSQEKVRQSFERMSDLLVRVNDRNRNAIEKNIQALEKYAETVNKSPVEKLVIQRDALIKKLGQEEEMIKRVTAAYQKLIQAEQQKSGPGGGGVLGALSGVNLQSFGNQVQQFAYNPLFALGGIISRVATALGPFGIAIGGTALALGAGAVAAYKMAESLGEYGVQIRRVQEITGLTAQEVGKFGFAAKAAGGDLEQYILMMRGLSQAVGGFSQRGEKGREVLEKLGGGQSMVDATGHIRDFAELLPILSEGLSKNSDYFSRNAAAIDLFRRAGLTAMPTLIEMNQHLKQSQDLHFLSDSEVDRLKSYNDQVVHLKTQWELLATRLKEPIVATLMLVLQGDTALQRWFKNANNFDPVQGGVYARQFSITPPNLNPSVPSQGLTPTLASGAEVGQLRSAGGSNTIEGAERQLVSLKQSFDEATSKKDFLLAQPRTSQTEQAVKSLTTEVDKAAAAYERARLAVEGLKKAQSEQQAIQEALRRGQLEAEQHQQESKYKYGISPVESQYLQFQRLPGVTSSQIEQRRQQLIPDLQQETQQAVAKLQAAAREAAQKDTPEIFRNANTTVDLLAKSEHDRAAEGKLYLDTLEKQTKELERQQPIIQKTLEYDLQRRQAEAEAGLRVRQILSPSGRTAGGQIATAAEEAQVRINFINEDTQRRLAEEQAIASANQSNRQIVADAEEKMLEIRLRSEQEISNARIQYIEKAAQIEKQQIDSIKAPLESLFTTLITKPQNFGEAITKTIHTEIIKASANSLADATAPLLRPIIYGENGQGGIAGAFRGASGGRGGLSDIKLTSDGSMPVTVTNFGDHNSGASFSQTVTNISSTAAATRPATLSPTGGLSTVSLPFPGGGAFSTPLPTALSLPGGAGGVAIPGGGGGGGTTTQPYFGASAPLYGGGTRSFGGFSLPSLPSLIGRNPASAIGPGGTSGFAGPVGGGSPLGGFRGLIGGSGGGYNLGSIFGRGPTPGPDASAQPGWTGTAAPPPGGYDPSIDMGAAGGAAGAAGSAASTGGSWATTGVGGPAGGFLGAEGTNLAVQGLTGRYEGTGKGIGEATAGGAMIGLEYGGPIGAAIGAAAGALAGVGEMLAGVMSPWAKAAMYAKQMYGITINDNMQNQIVNIAKSSFGGNIQLAVQSPQVRQMLGLYAAGTGQQNAKAIMDSTPHAAGLSMQGGQLYQDASYMYGQSYKYNSSLPTLGGSEATQLYNSPSNYPGSSPAAVASNGISGVGSLSLSLNVSGKSAKDFMTGDVVTPDFVQDQWASSQMGSDGRVSNSALIQDPGQITA